MGEDTVRSEQIPALETKTRVIEDLCSVREDILAAVDRLPRERQDQVFLGIWSVKDLLAHLVGWDRANIESVKELLAGQKPSVFAQWNPNWSAYNARLVREYKRDSMAELCTLVGHSHRALVDYLGTVPADQFDKYQGVRSPRGKPITISGYLQAEIDDEQEHLAQIRGLNQPP